jgi:hypothetical protein
MEVGAAGVVSAAGAQAKSRREERARRVRVRRVFMVISFGRVTN